MYLCIYEMPPCRCERRSKKRRARLARPADARAVRGPRVREVRISKSVFLASSPKEQEIANPRGLRIRRRY